MAKVKYNKKRVFLAAVGRRRLSVRSGTCSLYQKRRFFAKGRQGTGIFSEKEWGTMMRSRAPTKKFQQPGGLLSGGALVTVSTSAGGRLCIKHVPTAGFSVVEIASSSRATQDGGEEKRHTTPQPALLPPYGECRVFPSQPLGFKLWPLFGGSSGAQGTERPHSNPPLTKPWPLYNV